MLRFAVVLNTRNLTKSQELLGVALDISAATGADLQATSTALGKAFTGNRAALGIGTTAGSFDVNLGYAFRVIGATIQAFNNSGTVGSSEDSTLQLRNVTQGTSSSIGTFKTNAAALAQTEVTYTGLNISVAATDFFALQWDFPAAGTNPTNVFMRVNLLIQFT